MSPMMSHIYTENKYADPLLKKKIVFNRMNYKWIDHSTSKASNDF